MKQQKTDFEYTYSAKAQAQLKKIRDKYLVSARETEEDKIERVQRLDRGVTKTATAVAVSVGSIGTLIMGAGMSLIMSDFGRLLASASEALAVGIALGFVGIACIICAYPLYGVILKRKRRKLAPEILRLTDEIMEETNR